MDRAGGRVTAVHRQRAERVHFYEPYPRLIFPCSYSSHAEWNPLLRIVPGYDITSKWLLTMSMQSCGPGHCVPGYG